MFSLFDFSVIFQGGGQLTPFAPICGRPWTGRIFALHVMRPQKWSGEQAEYRRPLNILRLVQTHTHPFNGTLFGTTQVSRYQKGKTNLDFSEARVSEWQWHQLGRMQVRTSLQSDITTPATHHSSFLQSGCPSCRPTNSVTALKAMNYFYAFRSNIGGSRIFRGEG